MNGNIPFMITKRPLSLFVMTSKEYCQTQGSLVFCALFVGLIMLLPTVIDGNSGAGLNLEWKTRCSILFKFAYCHPRPIISVFILLFFFITSCLFMQKFLPIHLSIVRIVFGLKCYFALENRK